MSKRRQFVLDDRTNKLLEDLAADRAGNLSFVVREAIQLYADMDSRLEQIEQAPEFQLMMERSDSRARRAGCSDLSSTSISPRPLSRSTDSRLTSRGLPS